MTDHRQNPRNLGVVSALIVDDNAFDRRRLSRFANDTGLDFLIREAADPETFGIQLDQEKFDIIFVDLDLAGPTTGFDLLPIVRAHQVNSKAALVMVAGADQAETALQALREGFSDYIDKGALCASALERATLNAVQKNRLTQKADSATEETRSIESVLKSFADACSKEMRPMLLRMVRQVRQIRSELELAGFDASSVDSVEKTCARMDEFLLDLGGLANDEALSQIVRKTSTPTPPAPKPIPEVQATEPSTRPVAAPQRVRKERVSVFGRHS